MSIRAKSISLSRSEHWTIFLPGSIEQPEENLLYSCLNTRCGVIQDMPSLQGWGVVSLSSTIGNGLSCAVGRLADIPVTEIALLACFIECEL